MSLRIYLTLSLLGRWRIQNEVPSLKSEFSDVKYYLSFIELMMYGMTDMLKGLLWLPINLLLNYTLVFRNSVSTFE